MRAKPKMFTVMGPHHTKLGKIPLYFTPQKTIIMFLVSLHGTMFLLSLSIRDELNLFWLLGRDEPANPDVLSMKLNCRLSSQGEKKKGAIKDPDMHFPECLEIDVVHIHNSAKFGLHSLFFYQSDIYRLFSECESKNMQWTKPIVNIFRTWKNFLWCCKRLLNCF